jgi:hypothetical protein
VWHRRLEIRGGNAVRVGVAEAQAYVREHWEPIGPAFPHDAIENGEDAAEVDAALAALLARYLEDT